MQERYYTDDKNTLILLALLKEHGIKKAVVSPGTTNIALVASMQYDEWFEVYSSVDERSAAYMACGMADACSEPVILSCTGATASRNYFPGLTEAYYRKLPILAITGSHGEDIIGHLHAQSLDRSQAPKDSVVFSTSIKINDSEWKATTEVNKAILSLTKRGGGPVHIDLESAAYGGFATKELPKVRKITRVETDSDFPDLKNKRVAIFVGAHKIFNESEIKELEKFCEKYNSLVFVDHTSGYYGKYAVNYALVASQKNHYTNNLCPDILIHLGEVSGEFYCSYSIMSRETWRVNIDGELRDRFGNLTYLFEMKEFKFFSTYNKMGEDVSNTSYFRQCDNLYEKVFENIPQLPFGNIWIAQQLCSKIPANSELFLSIFNSLRSWNFFKVPDNIKTHCNVGGFGIDGALSTLLGSSIINKTKLHYGIIGDLAFFYDLNSLGNRHVSSNIRILLINNGIGTEFKNYDHPGSKWGCKADDYIAGGGHFGHKSKELVKHYAEDLGFEYMSAQDKKEFTSCMEAFVNPIMLSKPIILEVFTDSNKESEALKAIRSVESDNRTLIEKIQYVSKAITKRITK